MSIPENLIARVADECVVPFVGSGASLAVKPELFPTWTGVLNRFEQELEKNGESNAKTLVQTFIKENRQLDAAEEAHRYLGKHGFGSVMQSMFHATKPNDADLSLHESLWAISPNLIVTTNYDSVLEWANPNAVRLLNTQQEELGGLVNPTHGQMPRIWHWHGHYMDAGSLILTRSQYEELYSKEPSEKYLAARSQLVSLVANRQFLFVGFGLEDEFVMKRIKSVLELFSGSLAESYALVREGDRDATRLWNEYGIKLIEYKEHGRELVNLVRQISENASSQTTKSTSKNDAQLRKLSGVKESGWPGCEKHDTPSTVNSLPELIRTLEDYFAFRWEPESFEEKEKPIVYWPVRLREPSAIHAVQSFAAESLRRQGATIYLCLDDFGERKYDAARFYKRVMKWIERVDGDSDGFRYETFTKILGTQDQNVAWEHVQAWLGGDSYKLEKALTICKLYKRGMELEEYMKKGTGRLLTPGVVWACLKNLIDRFPNSSILTLGGHDECNLWQAWRERISDANSCVGHLYIPELSNTHMETTDLRWTAKGDVQSTLRQMLSSQAADADWKSENSIISWCLTGCVCLPQYLSTSDSIASRIVIGPQAESSALVQPTADAVANWILE